MSAKHAQRLAMRTYQINQQLTKLIDALPEDATPTAMRDMEAGLPTIFKDVEELFIDLERFNKGISREALKMSGKVRSRVLARLLMIQKLLDIFRNPVEFGSLLTGAYYIVELNELLADLLGEMDRHYSATETAPKGATIN